MSCSWCLYWSKLLCSHWSYLSLLVLCHTLQSVSLHGHVHRFCILRNAVIDKAKYIYISYHERISSQLGFIRSVSDSGHKINQVRLMNWFIRCVFVAVRYNSLFHNVNSSNLNLITTQVNTSLSNSFLITRLYCKRVKNWRYHLKVQLTHLINTDHHRLYLTLWRLFTKIE